MSETLLQTKLYIPPLRPNLIPRPLLLERLSQGLQRGSKLTLVCAPAGFGKSTLVAEWISSLRLEDDESSSKNLHSETQIAWLSLDKSDNDPVRFLTYFTAALKQVDPEIGRSAQTMLSSAQAPVMEPFITAIINDIMESNAPFTLLLILEDYHLIESPAIHDGINFLLDHLPPPLHLVLISRSDPPLRLSRLRARNQVTEIRARDLRFTTQETAAFLNVTMALNLTPEVISALERRTEGWIAGLQLAAMSLQQHDDPLSFVTAFAGDDRYVADYLIEEVLRQQPDHVQTFLLGTSILDSLSVSLCDAVLDEDTSRRILNELEASNLFIVTLDNQRRWYRYHHLFADLLRQRLEESVSSQDIDVLHQRASRWYEENDFFITAVEHALAGGDHQSVVRLIEEGEQEIFYGSRLNTLLSWWTQLPPELVESRPKLCLIYSWAWLATGHAEEAEGCLQAIEQELGAKMDELVAEREKAKSLDPAVRITLVEIAVVRGQLAIIRGSIGEALELSRLVLPYLKEDNQPYMHYLPASLRTIVYFNMGMAHKLQGELSKADQALSKALSLAQEQGNVHIVAVAFGQLANVQAMRGHLHHALRTCYQGLQLIQEFSGRRSPMSGRLLVELGNLLYERNDLETSFNRLEQGISVAKPWSYLDALLPGYTGLARLKAARGDRSGAFATFDELADLGQSNRETVMPAVESLRASLWIAEGNVDAAGLWAEVSGLRADDDLSYAREEEFIILIRVLMAQKKWDAAVSLIGRLLEATERGERCRRVIELLILRALLLDAQGQPDEALNAFTRALTLAEPQGFQRIFVDEGQPVARLLYRAATRGVMPGYAGELLAAIHDSESTPIAVSKVREPKSTIVDPLSERELEVLSCLAEGLSNREIGQRLTISLTTVKTHNRNIYRKLDVHSRLQAAAKGKALGIVGS